MAFLENRRECYSSTPPAATTCFIGASAPAGTGRPSVVRVSPLVRRLLDDLPLRPAYVMNLSWDIIARNPAAQRLFAIDERPAQERNMLWMLFADPQLNERLLEWEAQAPQIWPASAATTPARRRMR